MPALAFDQKPFIVIWETTRACQLACRHCRARAVRRRHPGELSTEEAFGLVDQLVEMDRPLFVLTGGDPMERDDLVEIVRYASARGLVTSITPSATPRVTFERMRALREAGLAHWAFSLDGSTPEIHDRFRGFPGTFALTMERIGWLRQLGIPLQINTTVSRFNVDDLPAMAELVERLGAVRWSLFFLIPTGRARLGDLLSPEQHEQVLLWLDDLSRQVPYDIKTTEGPQIRRIRAMREAAATGGGSPSAEDAEVVETATEAGRREAGGVPRSRRPVWDGNGILFVSHVGEVYPSGFLPVVVGSVRETPLARLYQGSPVLQALRDPSRYRGKCGYCPFRRLCGGSRARAYAVTGEYLEADPFCTYIPDPRAAAREGTGARAG
ncbi:MAG: TIGR04053 family radical SAM/SPASM domain-containing protein [Bacillota bacterium]|nr:TIGR04053 family radical SAM/SPASM domain-containing protein [Bacillota bacterium]